MKIWKKRRAPIGFVMGESYRMNFYHQKEDGIRGLIQLSSEGFDNLPMLTDRVSEDGRGYEIDLRLVPHEVFRCLYEDVGEVVTESAQVDDAAPAVFLSGTEIDRLYARLSSLEKRWDELDNRQRANDGLQVRIEQIAATASKSCGSISELERRVAALEDRNRLSMHPSAMHAAELSRHLEKLNAVATRVSAIESRFDTSPPDAMRAAEIGQAVVKFRERCDAIDARGQETARRLDALVETVNYMRTDIANNAGDLRRHIEAHRDTEW